MGVFFLPRLVLKGRTTPTHTMEVIGRKGRFGDSEGETHESPSLGDKTHRLSMVIDGY